MNIAFCDFVSLSCYGGSQIRIAEMAKLLSQNGHQVKIYATPYSYGGRRFEPEKFLEGIPYREAWRHKIKADVVYAYYYSPFAWRVFFSIGCPKVAGLHAPGLLSKSSSRGWLFQIIGTQDLSFFDAVRIQSPIFKFKHRRIFQIPDWVDTEFFAPQEQKADKFTILFVGRRHRDRRWSLFLEVASRLKQNYDFNFIATGEGNNLVHGLGLVDRKDMPRIYSMAHVLLHPAIADTFGLAIVEALSCGTPVITTPIPAHTNLETPLFYAQSVYEFIQEILKIYKSWRDCYEWYKEYCLSLRERILKYDVNNIFPKIETMLMEVAGNTR